MDFCGMFTVYVLKSKVAKKSYVGYTTDINRRIKEHNSGKGSYTKKYMPWIIVYTEEFHKENEAKKERSILSQKQVGVF
jgi:putative endonuclease